MASTYTANGKTYVAKTATEQKIADRQAAEKAKTTTATPKMTTTTTTPNTDYAAKMKDYLAKGGNVSDSAYKTLDDARNAKIATDPTLAKYKNDVQHYQAPTASNDPVSSVYGEDLSRDKIKETVSKNLTNDINAKYDPQISALKQNIENLKRVYQDQYNAVEPEYQASLQDLKQDTSDKNFETRENLNRMGNVASGLESDLINKLKIASTRERAKIDSDKVAKLREILTNKANAEAGALGQISSLEAAKGTELGGVDSKAFLDSVKTYSDLYNSANTIQNAEKEAYRNSMSGLGDSFDYQAKINEFKAINPNDWRIPILQQLREEKIQTKKQNTYADQMNDLKLKTDQYNYNELTDPNSITNQLNQMKLDAQKLEYTNAQLDNQIKQVQADFTLSPQYKQSLLDDLSYKKRSNELNLQKIQADITASNALANQRNSGDSATVKKSAYFDSSDKAVSETIANLEENPNIMVTDDKGNIVKDWLRTKGSQQWNQLINQIANLPISNEEKDFLLSKNRIPLP